MIEPLWLSRIALELLHGKSLAMFGGAEGLRDSGLLDCALARPQQPLAYSDSFSQEALAAAYAVGICRNHPFVDGNKRAGLLAALLFLEINGYELVLSDAVDAVRTMMAVAAGDLSEEQFTNWIANRCRQKGRQAEI